MRLMASSGSHYEAGGGGQANIGSAKMLTSIEHAEPPPNMYTYRRSVRWSRATEQGKRRLFRGKAFGRLLGLRCTNQQPSGRASTRARSHRSTLIATRCPI